MSLSIIVRQFRRLSTNSSKQSSSRAISTTSAVKIINQQMVSPLTLHRQHLSSIFTNNTSSSVITSQLNQQKRSLFIQTAETPNPESLKFIPNGRLVLGHNSDSVDTVNLEDGDDKEIELDNNNTNNNDSGNDTTGVYLTRKDHTLIARSPLAKSLFNLDLGIKSIYLGYDFITVTKYAEAHWTHLQTPIFGCIMDFYATNQPTFRDTPQITDTTILDDDDEVVAMIKELLETRIRPAVQEDGGDIRYVGFEEETGIVTVQLAGSCVGCPSSSVTLKNGVENMLMHYIPEVTNVVSLEEEDDDEYEGIVSQDDGDDVVVEQSAADVEEKKKMKSYQDKLAAAGIPFSD